MKRNSSTADFIAGVYDLIKSVSSVGVKKESKNVVGVFHVLGSSFAGRLLMASVMCFTTVLFNSRSRNF